MAHVRIYTTPYCPYCVAAKALLKGKQVDFEEIDVSGDPELRDRMTEESGGYTVPQIFIDGRPVGGYDDLSALDRRGALDSLLAGDPNFVAASSARARATR